MGLDVKDHLMIGLGLGAFSFNMIPLVFFFAIEFFNLKASEKIAIPLLMRTAMLQVMASLTALVCITLVHVAVVIIVGTQSETYLGAPWLGWFGIGTILGQMACIALSLKRCWTLYRRLLLLGS